MTTHHATPLKFLMPGWFASVMGLAGLSLALDALSRQARPGGRTLRSKPGTLRRITQ